MFLQFKGCLSVRRWSQEASEALQDFFDTTDLDVLCISHGENISSIMDCITDYISCYEDITIPTNKLWVTSDLKLLLNEKRGLAARTEPISWICSSTASALDLLLYKTSTKHPTLHQLLLRSLRQNPPTATFTTVAITPCMTVTTGPVRTQLERLYQGNAVGPNHISLGS